jgi:hypothetical protein
MRTNECWTDPLLHRHFPLEDNKKLVNYGAVAYPWDTSTMVDEAARDIHSSSWRFMGSTALTPYEFECITGPRSHENPLDDASIQVFLGCLGTFLEEHSLIHLLGVQRLDTIAGVGTRPGVPS